MDTSKINSKKHPSSLLPLSKVKGLILSQEEIAENCMKLGKTEN